MDVREKLEVIAHLGDHISYKEDIGICYDSTLAKVIEDAYMTLKNGVTVQEWISVKDRLPKPFTPVLVYRKSFGSLPPYIKVDKMILWNDDEQIWADEMTSWKNVTTHWMPLPEPPKRETIYCKDCENLIFSDCYGECAKGHKGIVKPNDTCEHARRKPPKGE